MHQLHREGLHEEANLDLFFDRYFGAPVLQTLEQPLVSFSAWPVATREALRALCVRYAQAIPEADHVVRADAGTRGHGPQGVQGQLLLYFGHQGGAQRAQYTVVAHVGSPLSAQIVLYIAGTANPQTRQRLISNEDPNRLIEGRVIGCVQDVNRMAAEATAALQAQRQVLIAQKGRYTAGFCPVFCQHRWGREELRPEDDAAREVTAYWGQRRQFSPPDQVQRERQLMTENNRYRYLRAVAYVREQVPVEQAWALALSEHA